VHILPAFGNRALATITAEEVSAWERQIAASGYSLRTARDARSTLATVLGDAIPRYIQANPAQRRRGKGRKGQRRIQRIEQAGKAWATPLQALLVAERCAALSGHDTDFVMIVTVAYTGMRWSEVIGLAPECVHHDRVDISWKLYELNGRFYRGRPKDGSIRPADLPPFLAQMLAHQVGAGIAHKCTCLNTEKPWCPGGHYVFLGPGQGHFRRSNYSERFFRPAADGSYPARGPRPAMPVLIDTEASFPGRPVPPWPLAVPGQAFQPPAGRGVIRLVSAAETGRCAICGRAWPRRLDGSIIAHKAGAERCAGSGEVPAQDLALASWLSVLTGLTPHGLRHGHQTRMDEDRIADVLKSERMGHEVPGMRGVYSHVSDTMRTELTVALQERWAASLRERARLAPCSIVPVLDALLAEQSPSVNKIGSQIAPKNGHGSGELRPRSRR